jgi:hypothetical protein
MICFIPTILFVAGCALYYWSTKPFDCLEDLVGIVGDVTNDKYKK